MPTGDSWSAPPRRWSPLPAGERLQAATRPVVPDRDPIFHGRSAPQLLGGFNKKVGSCVERVSEPFDDVERWSFPPIFKVTHIRAVHARFLSEFLLRQAGLLSVLPDDETEGGSKGDMGAVHPA